MQRFLNGGRNHPPPNMNKPLPEPLVDPDEGKTPIGELVIVPIQGKDLPNRERFGKQDPFILFKLGNVSKRSSTDIRGGQRPRWKDDQINIFMYQSDAKDATSLYVTCLDEDPQKNDLIGDCVINLAKVLEQGEHDDWFELSFKGREAGELMLQLTYYSHDPKHPTNKMNRPPPATPTNGAPARRPIHPVKESKKADEKPVEDEHVDEGPVYKPPVVSEPPTPQVPMVPAAAYPYGTLPTGAGRPVSPSAQGHYVSHPTPHVPPAVPYGHPAAANPYGANPAAYPGYPTAGGAPAYPDPALGADPSKRVSFPGQPVQAGGFLPTVYPPHSPGFPPQAPGQAPVAGAYSPAFPPHSPGFPPNGPYPPVSNANVNSPYPPAQLLPNNQGMPNNGPPAGYPFAAPGGVYPPNSNSSNNSNGSNGSGPGFPGQQQGFSQGGPGFPTGPGNNSFPGAFPGNNNNNSGNNHPYNNNGGNMDSHSNGNLNNMNNNGGFNNGGNNFNNNSNFNNGGNNNNNSFNNGGSNFNNNNNGGNNFNSFNNNGNNFNNNSNNFNNNGNNFNNNNSNGGNFSNNNNFNNNGGNSFNNNNNNNSGFGNNNNNGGGYSSATFTKPNTISPTPIPAAIVKQPTVMFRPDEF
ncbi:hypothetical protein BC939DRAFT_531523 [Gamsiella multidivaricata]|uniref:uncharacterized protein n=1 Tax=Gamsiella multidivaricata TaxID=101098 RepID=UPI0022211D7B|nr:uncharacterized protein BC939DRAFT_531523 [Gamsiella multidivaricata]KAG0364230.1 hypothetical protein BGZ54_007713 [Gamsiella multidivaricata]KAI7819050.1 hypothetical protein BC939DRAFT_531523 [Gamsiella multidivaricata]